MAGRWTPDRHRRLTYEPNPTAPHTPDSSPGLTPRARMLAGHVHHAVDGGRLLWRMGQNACETPGWPSLWY